MGPRGYHYDPPCCTYDKDRRMRDEQDRQNNRRALITAEIDKLNTRTEQIKRQLALGHYTAEQAVSAMQLASIDMSTAIKAVML